LIGVHGIFHTASPIDFSLTTYDEFITIAVKGTNSIFESALKAGPQLESLVVTSSVAAITNSGVEPGYVFTEKDFAHTAFDKATSDHTQGIDSPAGILYSASKTAAERAVWEFRDKHNVSCISRV
jgi:nucleoside-diphosphate-sugar epimerase